MKKKKDGTRENEESLEILSNISIEGCGATVDGDSRGLGKKARRQLIPILLGRLIATREIVGGYNMVVDRGTGEETGWGLFDIVVCSTITGFLSYLFFFTLIVDPWGLVDRFRLR